MHLIRTHRTFAAALAASAGLFAFAAWDQSFWWRTDEEYAFGWLVPLFALFIVLDRRESIATQLEICASPGSSGDSPEPARSAGGGCTIGAISALILAGGAVLFEFGALSRARNGASHPGTFAITSGACMMSLACIALCAPSSGPRRRSGRESIRLAGLFLFPACVWLLSAPLVAELNAPLRLWLLNYVVGGVDLIFRTLHLPIVRHGNLFSVPDGEIAVVDACIGIRSLTGLCVGSLFLGSAFLPAWRRPLLLGCAILLALAGNLVRVLVLNLWAYRFGMSAVTERLHDTLGWIAIAVAVAALLALVNRWSEKPAPDGPGAPAAPGAR